MKTSISVLKEETNRHNAQNNKLLNQMESQTSSKEKNVSNQIQAVTAECEKKIKIAEQKAAEANHKLQVCILFEPSDAIEPERERTIHLTWPLI